MSEQLSPITRIGVYELLAKLGEGGMGEVYRARDLQLKRDVALKVLPAALAADADRLARFQREAELLAVLNHPHIAQIYGLAEGPGEGGPRLLRALVMELVEGEDLAERLRRGPVPLDEALPWARQLAEALEAAHEAGIVHRDLKPSNIKVRPDSTLKVLDFGLAKALDQTVAARDGSSAHALADSPTITTPAMTRAGIILGTAAYMSPEQARGRSVDKRVDIWAFGCVLYEMLTGQRVFAGDDVTDIMTAILRDEPAWAALPADTPAGVRALLARCLDKDPRRRLRDIGEARFALEGVARAPAAATTPTAKSRALWRQPVTLALVFSSLALGGALAWILTSTTDQASPQARRVVRFSVDMPAGRTLGTLALSPDASHLAYVGTEDGHSRIYVRPFDQSSDMTLAGTDGATSLFFSPDGEWIAFFAEGRLRKIPARGGEVVSIADAPFTGTENTYEPTGTWADDGTIVFTVGGRGLSRVPASGGSSVSLTTPSGKGGDHLHMWPHVPRGGAAAMFTVSAAGDYDAASVEMVPLGGGSRTRVIASGARAKYLETGHVIYTDRGQLVAARFDASSQTAADAPVALIDNLGFDLKEPLFDVSAAGDLAYAEALELLAPDLLRVDRNGRVESLKGAPPAAVAMLSLSPDGTRLVGFRGSQEREFRIWMLDLQRGIPTQLPMGDNAHAPVWLPDGRTLAFTSDRAGPMNVFAQPADGSGAAEQFTDGPMHEDPGSWSRDGRWLAYAAVSSKTGTDIWAYDRAARRSVVVRGTEHDERFPTLSPDARWLAYASDESGRLEVYVEAFPGGAGRVQLSGDGGTEPVWSSSGQELFYRSGSRLMSIKLQPGATLSASSPTMLFEGVFDGGVAFGPPGYAVSPDGRSFYFVRKSMWRQVPRRINVVLNWIEEFKQRVAK